jgi:ABC-type nitrate/sulfonate/bicarbonate transport system substrate-binding protein
LNPFPAGACSTRADVVTAKPVALRRFYEAMVRAKEFIGREPEQSRHILAKWTNSDATSAAFVKGYEYYAFGELDDVKLARVQELADLYGAADILPKKIKVDSMFLKADDIP